MRHGTGIFLGLMAAAIIARADPMEDVARIHCEAIGGSRLEACAAIAAEGTVTSGGRDLKFELVAARPNRVRLTMHGENRTLVQATDGVAPPWQSDSTKSPTVQAMNPDDAREFNADAEFDDPLASPKERGFTLDFAGEMTWQHRKVLKVLVTRADTAPSFLLVDPDSYFVLARLTTRRQPSGREVEVETRYEDFRPVEGMIFPHRLVVVVDGAQQRETVFADVRVIPEPAPEIFARPLLAETEKPVP